MPKVAYSKEQREEVRESLISTCLDLMVKQGTAHTTLEQICNSVGISRTFFYTFYPAKEDLVVEAILRQQPKILQRARKLMDDPALRWREGVEQFLFDLCYGEKSGFIIWSIDEQQAIRERLSPEKLREFQGQRMRFLKELFHILCIPVNPAVMKLLGNLIFSTVIIRKAIPDALPFLFAEAADETAQFQLMAILNYIEELHKCTAIQIKENR